MNSVKILACNHLNTVQPMHTYLKTAFTKTVRYKDFYTSVTKGGAAAVLKSPLMMASLQSNLTLIEQLFSESPTLNPFNQPL